MTKEEIFEEAKIRYPVGTKFKVAHDPSRICTVSSHERYKTTFYEDHVNLLVSDGDRGVEGGTVNFRGQWAEIVSKPESKPSKVLIFNDIYIGDIVVSLSKASTYREEGSLLKVISKSSRGLLYYDAIDGTGPTNNSSSLNWRKATPEEEEAYNKGIRNIKDIVAPVISPRFEKGKWYTESSRPLLYIKFDKVVPDDKDCIHSSEKIYKGAHQYIANDLWVVKGVNWTLVDISVIQQYLPDGHVDKLVKTPQFIVGKWYKWRQENHNCSHYGKVETINSTHFQCSPWICRMETHHPSGSFDLNQSSQIEEINISLVQKYLPEGHVDKITTKYTPKKGDYFVVDGLGSLEGRIMLCRYDIYSDEVRSTGPFIGDFNTPKNLTFSKLTGVCFGGSKDRKVRPATQDEIEWLEACIKANKFIPKEKALKPISTELTEFPSDGQCKTTDERFSKYLSSRSGNSGYGKLEQKASATIISWNKTGWWYVIGSSGKKEYKLEELEKFLPKLENMAKWEPIKDEWVVYTGVDDPYWKKGKVFQCSYMSCGYVYEKNPKNGGEPNCRLSDVRKALSCEISSVKDEEWCVAITPENKDVVLKYVNQVLYNEIYGHPGSLTGTSKYYGRRGAKLLCEYGPTGTVLTTEEFYKKIGHVTKNPCTELTSLPDEWYCIYSNEEEFNVMKNHFKSGWGYCSPNGERGCSNKPNCNNWIVDKNDVTGYTKITFEQFKKWVLKQEPKEQVMENYTGRWIKILRSSLTGSRTEAGKYYRIKKHTSGQFELDINVAPYVAESENAHYEIMPIGWTPETQKAMKYKIGDGVTIINVHAYKTENDGIPRDLMIHGSPGLHKSAPNAKIVAIHKEYYIVNYTNEYSKTMQLGFLEKDITLRQQEKAKDYVHVTTQEQWDFVTQKLGYKWTDGNWPKYNTKTLINLITKSYNDTTSSNSYYSFEEWCTKFGHVFTPKEIPTTTLIPKFSIGQKLKVCKKEQDVNGWGYAPLSGSTERIYLVGGDEGEVRKINVIGGRNYYELKCHSAYRGICEDCLTLVGESVTSSVSELWPVGTKVIINPSSEYAYQSKGTEGKITSHRSEDHVYNVEWEKGGGNCYRRTDLLLANIKETDPDTKATIMVDAEVTHIRLPKSASVTLKNTEREVNILVKTKQTIKLN